jgi:hypothetical protein
LASSNGLFTNSGDKTRYGEGREWNIIAIPIESL